ncbi:hypothetical protein BDF19DRAFT_302445 [Syncephalis fuscata]|nr:hypothetical protein BDF19DRAFT_302445 [Syncephalis fuscata]
MDYSRYDTAYTSMQEPNHEVIHLCCWPASKCNNKTDEPIEHSSDHNTPTSASSNQTGVDDVKQNIDSIKVSQHKINGINQKRHQYRNLRPISSDFRWTFRIISLIGLLLSLIGMNMFIRLPLNNKSTKNIEKLLEIQRDGGVFDLQYLNRLIEEQKQTDLFDVYTDLYGQSTHYLRNNFQNKPTNLNHQSNEPTETASKQAVANYLISIYESRVRAERFSYRFKCIIGFITILLGVGLMSVQVWAEWMCLTDVHDKIEDRGSNEHADITNEQSESISINMPHNKEEINMPVKRNTFDCFSGITQYFYSEKATLSTQQCSSVKENMPEPRPFCATLGTGITWTPTWTHGAQHSSHM